MPNLVPDRQVRRFNELLRGRLDLGPEFLIGDVVWDSSEPDAQIEITAFIPAQEVYDLFNRAGREVRKDP